VDVGRVHGAAGGGCDRRHPVCHEVEQARHQMKSVEPEADWVTAFADGRRVTRRTWGSRTWPGRRGSLRV